MLKSNFFLCLLFSSVCLYATEWKYLESEAFQMRYTLAADFMKDLDQVVEIGGYKTPINNFLPEHISALCVDPRANAISKGNKRVLSEYFSKKHIPREDSKYGVVILGLELGLDDEGWNSLLNLIKFSNKLVIGYPLSYPLSVSQHNYLINRLNLKLTKKVVMDFSGNDFGNSTNSWPPRVKRAIFFYEVR